MLVFAAHLALIYLGILAKFHIHSAASATSITSAVAAAAAAARKSCKLEHTIGHSGVPGMPSHVGYA